MRLVIDPYKSVGPLRFGLTREEVRDLLVSPVESFMRNDDDLAETDDFAQLGIFVEYDKTNKCIAVEMFSPAEPIFLGKDLLGAPYAELRNWVKSMDSHAEIDESGLVSTSLGIGLYAEISSSDTKSHAESAVAFKYGYYEE
jgi:hypothetical protein